MTHPAIAAPEPSGPPRFRLRRESELPVLSRTSGEETERPDLLASERQERRQVVAIARVVCQATTEALNGARPVSQLSKWLTAEVLSKVEQREAIMARHRSHANVRPQKLSLDAVHTTHPLSGTWEVSVVFTDEHRTRACAMRLQAYRGRWRVTALELG